jgi:hypothetical protein
VISGAARQLRRSARGLDRGAGGRLVWYQPSIAPRARRQSAGSVWTAAAYDFARAKYLVLRRRFPETWGPVIEQSAASRNPTLHDKGMARHVYVGPRMISPMNADERTLSRV